MLQESRGVVCAKELTLQESRGVACAKELHAPGIARCGGRDRADAPGDRAVGWAYLVVRGGVDAGGVGARGHEEKGVELCAGSGGGVGTVALAEAPGTRRPGGSSPGGANRNFVPPFSSALAGVRACRPRKSRALGLPRKGRNKTRIRRCR